MPKDNMAELLHLMTTLAASGRRHAFLEAGGTIRTKLGQVLVTCKGVEGQGHDEKAALANWTRRATTGPAPAAQAA